jgi:hypothetical protein
LLPLADDACTREGNLWERAAALERNNCQTQQRQIRTVRKP